jgi:hypothetical protein
MRPMAVNKLQLSCSCPAVQPIVSTLRKIFPFEGKLAALRKEKEIINLEGKLREKWNKIV